MKTPIIASITTLIVITLIMIYFYNDLKKKDININLSFNSIKTNI